MIKVYSSLLPSLETLDNDADLLVATRILFLFLCMGYFVVICDKTYSTFYFEAQFGMQIQKRITGKDTSCITISLESHQIVTVFV